jgi:hypothetical protein
VLAQQAAADLLLLYVAPGPGSAGVVTGKLFEYLASGRPVLALVPPDGTAAGWVRDARAGEVVAPDDVPAITTALVRAWDTWLERGRVQSPDLDLPTDVRDSIDRSQQVGRLAEVLRAVAPR